MAKSETSQQHPCMTCGACCNFYRASFHWTERSAESYGVPEEMTVQISPYFDAMKGTDQQNPSCIAFKGETGKTARCSIYANRPNCCRVLKASFEDGTASQPCDDARAGKGMPLLSPSDWLIRLS